LSHFELDDFNAEECLEKVHASVLSLEYDCCDERPSWAELAKAFPNLKEFSFSYFGSDSKKRRIETEFFRRFPDLTRLKVDELTVDLTGVEPEHLNHLTSVNFDKCINGQYLSVFGNLPVLETLEVKVSGGDVVFKTGTESGLKNLKLQLINNVRSIDCDLAASSLAKLELGESGYQNDNQGAVDIKALSLPATLNELKLALTHEPNLPDNLLGDNPELELVHMTLGNATLPPKLLGDVQSIDKLTIALRGETPSLPETLFANLKRVDDLRLELEYTPCSAALLPAGLPLKVFHYRNASGLMTDANELRLPELDEAWLDGFNDEQLAWLEHSPKITYLNIAGIKEMPDDFPFLPALESFILRSCRGQSLPASIRSNPFVTHYSHWGVQLEKLGDLSAMTGLKNVRLVPGEHTQNKLPELDDLASAPALKEVELRVSMESFEPALLKLPIAAQIEFYPETLAKEFQILRTSRLSEDQMLELLTILANVNKPAQLPTMPAAFHLTMMEAKYNRFKAQHKSWLREQAKVSELQQPFGAGSCLFIAGRSGIKTTELKVKAAEIGFRISKKLDNSVTHLLLGSCPKQTADYDLTSLKLIDDTVLQQCFTTQAPKFLQQDQASAGGMTDSVLAMLASPDEGSHKVAVEMLAQGGVTAEMHIPLFLILKTTADNAFRKEIKHLLAGQGDEAFQLAVSDRILFHNVRGLDQYGSHRGQCVMVDKLKKQRKKWGEALCTAFAKAYYDRFGDGLMYVLMQKEQTPERLAILSELVEGDCLNWRRGAGFDLVLQDGDEKERLKLHWHPRYKMNYDELLGAAKTPLPAELPLRESIRKLNLGNCLLSTLPTGIDHYQHISELSLSFNPLEKLPTSLANFTQLESLDLSYCHFREFPKVLLKLSNLKRLDLRRACRVDYDSGYDDPSYRSLTVPDAFRALNPDCEILED